MANNEPTIKITAALDRDESVKQIRDVDIPAITDILNKESLLKIKCTIDDDSIKNIKNQLSNLKINIGANVQPTVVKNTPVTETEIKINATSVKEQLTELKQTINANITGDAKEVMDGLVSQIKEGSTVWTTWLRGANGQLKSFSISVKDATGEINKYNYAINELGNAKFLGSSGSTKGVEAVRKEIDTLIKQFNELRSGVGSFTGIYAEVGEGANKTKVTFESLGKSLEDLQNGKKSVADVRAEMVALNGAVKSVNSTLGEAQGKGFNKFENAEADARNFDTTLKKVQLDLKGLNQTDGEVKKLSKRLKDVSTEANALVNVDIKNQDWANSYQKVNVELKSIQSAIKIVKQLEKQDKSSAAQRTLETLDKIRDAYRGIEKYTKVLNSSSAGQAQKQSASAYVLNYSKQLSSAEKLLTTEKLITSEVRKQINELKKRHTEVMNGIEAEAKDDKATEEKTQKLQLRNSLLKTIEDSLKKINSLETQSGKDVESNSAIHAKQIGTLEKQVTLAEKRLGTEKLLDKEAKQRIATAKRELEIQRELRQNRQSEKSQSNNSALKDSITNDINRTINTLSSKAANATLRNNAENALVKDQIANIKALIAEYQDLFKILQTDSTPQSLVNIKNRLEQLKPKLDATISGTNRLTETLRNSSANNKLANDIKAVNVAMSDYAKKNQNVVNSTKLMSDGVTTFAEKWRELVALSSSNLDAEGLKRLNQQLKMFKQNADAAGLSSKNFFGSLQTGLEAVGIYLSAQTLAFAVRRYVGAAVDELKNMNDILTEISKTSDRTDESLKRLGEDSFDRASMYGRTASDYLLGVQEMSRAGFSEQQSEDLAELSLKAQAAGDMTAEMANQYIIATNAAYDLEGSEQKLTAILDSQNYITNRNALNMEHLAEATKLSASQASVSGVAIDQLTSAVGTMIATTQQGGEIAGRAFRGILMNIQQVQAEADEIGDGGEAITAESLSKYEKASKALGVSLKEVKNGVWSLRDPMQVLKELSEAVRKESEGSVKVANLISSVGGKYRGNQLIALLDNWETYEKMLAEFNSEQAIGSAMKESEKSANNWSGSINKLKNSWTELVNEFVKSEEVITIVQKLTNGIENLSSSDTIKGLKSLMDTIIDLGEAVKTTTDFFEKRFPTISKYVGKGLKQGFNSVRGFGFINGLSKLREQLNKQEDSAKEAAKVSEKLRRTYLENASTMDEESTSIRSITSEYASLVVGLEDTTAVKGKLMELQNKIVDQYGLEAGGIDLVNKSLEENIRLLTKKAQKENEDFLTRNASGIDEAKRIFGIDDLNGKTKSGSSFMDFQITKSMLDTNKYGSSDHYDEVRTEANIIFQTVKNIIAEEYSDVFDNIDFTGEVQGERFGEVYLNDFVIGLKEGLTAEQQTKAAQALTEALAKTFNMKGKNISYFDMESLIEDAQESAAIFSQANDIIVDALKRTGDKEVWDAFEKDTETYNKYLDLIKQVGKYQSELNKEDSTYADRVIASRGLQMSLLELQRIAEQYPVVADTMSSSLNEMGVSFEDATRSVESAQESWKKSLDEAQQGVLSDIDKIKSAMQSLAEGKKLSSKDFWEIAGLDTDNVLSDIRVVNGEFTVGAESLMKLKDSIIRQEIENYGHQIEQIKAEHKNTLEEIEASAQEVANLEREINEKNIDLTQTVFGNIDTDSRQVLEWTNNNLLTYEDAIESWGSSIEDLAGSVSTVFGAYEEFDGVDIAFSPILQTENGAVMLSKSTVDRYIQQLIDNAGEGWTTELLLELDTKGLEIDGYKVKNLIADIGDTAAKTSQQMHYVGKTGAFARAKTAYDEINESAKGFLGTLKNTVLMQKYLNSMLGNTVDIQKALEAQKKTLEDEVSALKKEAEGRLNAQLHVIDQEIDKHEKEVDLLEKEKDALNEQLEALEKQKEELDKIVDNYDTVASFVQSTIEKQVEEIEDNRSKVEDYYDSLINKLKEENDERQAAIDKEEKLNALNNAKKNKVRYYDGARGWTYGVDQEALKKAQKDLDAFEADEKINALEKEKDSKLKPYDDQIKQLEEYAESWGKATDFIVEESNELLAEQILGVNWREKIENKDENILKTFQTQYRNYNTQLDNLTNKEIESLKKSISAKDNEIKAKQEQVTWWKNYKDSIQSATKGVEDYVQYLNTVDLSNPEKNLTDFTTTYKRFVTDIASKEADIIRITNELNNLGSAYSGLGGSSMAAGLGSSLGAMGGIAKQIGSAAASLSVASGTDSKVLNNIYDVTKDIKKNQEKAYFGSTATSLSVGAGVTAYASGGVNTNTGMAWLDGTVTRPELILNNTDVSKLYNWIHTMSSSQAILQSKSNGIAKTSNAAIFNISNMEINGVQNPIEFAKQFEQNINRYWNTKLTESKVY